MKYTVQLDQTDEDTIQDFVYRACRELGMQVDKSDAYCAFLALLRDDPELVERVRAYIVAAKTSPMITSDGVATAVRRGCTLDAATPATQHSTIGPAGRIKGAARRYAMSLRLTLYAVTRPKCLATS